MGVIPEERTTYIASQFIQDEITLAPDLLQLILGCKLEQNSYTYFEYQPTIRLLYTPDKKHSLWGAVSRAVHTPSRVDENLFATTNVDPIFGTAVSPLDSAIRTWFRRRSWPMKWVGGNR